MINLMIRCSEKNGEIFLRKAFEEINKKIGLKFNPGFNPGLVLIDLQTTGPGA